MHFQGFVQEKLRHRSSIFWPVSFSPPFINLLPFLHKEQKLHNTCVAILFVCVNSTMMGNWEEEQMDGKVDTSRKRGFLPHFIFQRRVLFLPPPPSLSAFLYNILITTLKEGVMERKGRTKQNGWTQKDSKDKRTLEVDTWCDNKDMRDQINI